MYVGRIVAVGRTASGALSAMYRVSSRSFPNRRVVQSTGVARIVPAAGHEADIKANPYIAYNCVRHSLTVAVAANGTHCDPIAEKLGTGMRMRDALVTCLHAMDYERDDLSTPRIAAVVDRERDTAALGIVLRYGLFVLEIDPAPGTTSHLATYELNSPGEHVDPGYRAETAADACRYMMGEGAFASLEKPVCAASAMAAADGFDLAIQNGTPR